ncbi:hypothetical protein CAY59_15945 [Vibrio campbellii]|uniref:glycosyltransferase n=1 Tax=Vibrio campbellii TaxID=680 RepID=UPI000A2FC110|nr:glycosyltransferase [Vibrio campbellii]ARR45712.1 hypothetical protein CAY59_15945 [Vibrio campbellii]
MKVLINASNLHAGGGVQVASSFINQLPSIKLRDMKISLICSSAVYRNLTRDSLAVFERIDNVNVYGFSRLSQEDRVLFSGYDVCFSVFGPVYFDIPVEKHVCGFAQPWIAYPKNDVYPTLNLYSWLLTKAKYFIQKQFFKKYDELIVEHDSVRNSLINNGFKNKIRVVCNSYSSVFDNPQLWLDIPSFNRLHEKRFVLGFIGRPYLHKNISILKQVDTILKDKYQVNVDFLFTLTNEEMNNCEFDTIDNFHTVGEIDVVQCPDFYKKIDALIFPTLLECFSVSPLEAMKMQVPVIASNKRFITEVYGDACLYIDPLNADDIAKKIVILIGNESLIKELVDKGKCHLIKSPTALDRTIQYLSIIGE